MKRHSDAFAAFTLIELLVVVSIIALLAAILLPAIQIVRRSAQTTLCSGRQKALLQANLVYAGDNEGQLPPVGHPTALHYVQWNASYPIFQKLGYLIQEGYVEVSKDALNCAGRSRVYSPTDAGFVKSGIAMLYPVGMNGYETYTLQQAARRLPLAGGTMMRVNVILACMVSNSPVSVSNSSINDLPHQGTGVVIARLDGSTTFYRSDIRLWPGAPATPTIPGGNDNASNQIWKLLQSQ